MFQCGMTEDQTGRAEIEDIGMRLLTQHFSDELRLDWGFRSHLGLDPEVLKEMLRFMYTGLVKYSLEARIILQKMSKKFRHQI